MKCGDELLCFSLKEKFKFLDEGIDFPFYNDVPKLSTGEWSIVLISVICNLSV